MNISRTFRFHKERRAGIFLNFQATIKFQNNFLPRISVSIITSVAGAEIRIISL